MDPPDQLRTAADPRAGPHRIRVGGRGGPYLVSDGQAGVVVLLAMWADPASQAQGAVPVVLLLPISGGARRGGHLHPPPSDGGRRPTEDQPHRETPGGPHSLTRL